MRDKTLWGKMESDELDKHQEQMSTPPEWCSTSIYYKFPLTSAVYDAIKKRAHQGPAFSSENRMRCAGKVSQPLQRPALFFLLLGILSKGLEKQVCL